MEGGLIMISERQKTDALSDAVEIPILATHYSEELDQYFRLDDGIWYKLLNDSWWLTKPPFTDLISV